MSTIPFKTGALKKANDALAGPESHMPSMAIAPPPATGASGAKTSIFLPAFRRGDWLQENEPTLPQELIQGVLHKGCKMVLGGGSKSNKTWSLIDLGLSIAHGLEWWGLPTIQGKVVFMNFEVPEPFFHNRLKMVARARGVTIPDDFIAWNLRGHSAPADELLPELAERLKGERAAAIVIDPVYKLAVNADENSAKDIGKLVESLEKLAHATEAAVICGAHFSKGNQAGKEAMDRISGSGVWARDPDAILTMTKHETPDAFTVEATLRNCPPLDPFVVRRNHPLMVVDNALDPAALKQIKQPKKVFSVDDIVNVLPVGAAHTTTAWQKLAEAEGGVKSSRFYELKKEIVETGHRKITINEGKITRVI